jgi:hypothetical protein
MQKNMYVLLACITLFIGCSLPDTKKPVAMMENYWTFYKAKQYDSLRTFYAPKAEKPEERFAALFKALSGMYETQGAITQTMLTSVTSQVSTGESSIELIYKVVHERATVEHQFKIIETSKDVFKIQDHSFSR